jgi:hypothetical protein
MMIAVIIKRWGGTLRIILPFNQGGVSLPGCIVRGKQILLGVEELHDRGIIHVVTSDQCITGRDVLGDAGYVVQVSHRHQHSQVTHIAGFLGDDHVDRVGFEHFDGGLGGVEGDDFDFSTEALIGNHLTGALGGEDVGAEDASQIGFLLQHGFHLSLGLGGIVVVVVYTHQGDIRVIGDRFFAASFAGVGGADAGLDILDVDLAFAADGFDQGVAGDHAAELVIGGDEGEREFDRAVSVITIADESVSGEDGEAGIAGFLQRGDHGVLVNRSQEEEIQVTAGDHGVQHRGLNCGVPFVRDLDNQLSAKAVGGCLRAALHGEVEGILYAS